MVYKTWEKFGIKTSLLGFGCMRLPTKDDGKIDEELSKKMLNYAYDNGVNYYDNAYMYLDYQDEKFVGKWLSTKSRDTFYVTSKMPVMMIKTLNDAKRIFEEQLNNLQVTYFDFYLIHALNKNTWNFTINNGVFDYLLSLKKAGKIHHLGFSFHDEFDVFEKIINYYDWDFCQIQYNYIDQDIQAGNKGYDLANSKGIPMVIMEPVKGGSLSNLPSNIDKIFKDYNQNLSTSSWGYRWVASHNNVHVVLSGMSSFEQVKDNINTFNAFRPLDEEELGLVEKVREELNKRVFNGCTGCRYCQPCPQGIKIPYVFRAVNSYAKFADKKAMIWDYDSHITNLEEGPEGCVKCGLCENKCPQHLPIREDLQRALKIYQNLKMSVR